MDPVCVQICIMLQSYLLRRQELWFPGRALLTSVEHHLTTCWEFNVVSRILYEWDHSVLVFRSSSSSVKPVLTRDDGVQHRGWSLFSVCQSLTQKDSQETTCLSRQDVLSQAGSSLVQLCSPSPLHIHLGWRRSDF